MTLTGAQGKTLTFLVLLIQLCLPLSGQLYIATVFSTNEAGHTGKACAHSDAGADHESQDDHEQIPHCHELDAPYDTVNDTVIKLAVLVSPLTTSYKGVGLPGHGAPLEFPPRHIV